MASEPEPVAWEQITKNIHTMLIRLQVGGCTCDTKSPTLDFHDVRCAYRQAAEAAGVLDTLSDQIEAALLAAEQRGRESLRSLLTELYGDVVWNAYNTGIIVSNGTWIDAGMSDAEWLRAELHLAPTPQPADVLRAALPGLIDRLVAAAIRKGDTPDDQ